MKLRIKGSSIRLRLSQFEVTLFAEIGEVSDQIDFGATKLVYKLSSSERKQMEASFANDQISIDVPKQKANQWTSTEEVGFGAAILTSNGDSISILVEKDFQCLTDRPNEDESDLFENPLSKHDC